jgi:hypothetical protein
MKMEGLMTRYSSIRAILLYVSIILSACLGTMAAFGQCDETLPWPMADGVYFIEAEAYRGLDPAVYESAVLHAYGRTLLAAFGDIEALPDSVKAGMTALLPTDTIAYRGCALDPEGMAPGGVGPQRMGIYLMAANAPLDFYHNAIIESLGAMILDAAKSYGLVLVHDYGYGSLVQLATTDGLPMEALGRTREVEDPGVVAYRSFAGRFDPSCIPSAAGLAPGVYLLALFGPLDLSVRGAVEQTGLKVLDSANPYGMLVKGDSQAMLFRGGP